MLRMYRCIRTASNTTGQSTECDKYASDLIEKLDGINLYAFKLIRKLNEMESMQADMVNNLNISCSSQDEKNDLITDSLDHGAGCKEPTPIYV